jgi:YVTN family beta-propeller protein
MIKCIVVLLINSWFMANAEPILYMTSADCDAIVKVDAGKGAIVESLISVGSRPRAIAIGPDGKYAYVVNSYDNTLSVVNLKYGKEVGSPVKVGKIPWAVAITPDGKYVLVSNLGDHSVSIVDASMRALICRDIPVGSHPWSIMTTPDNKFAYVTNYTHFKSFCWL